MGQRRLPPAGRAPRTRGHQRPPIRSGVLGPHKPLENAARIYPSDPQPQAPNPQTPKGGPGS
jgi:hypothetical protein